MFSNISDNNINMEIYMTYNVYYKKSLLWHKLKNVKGDGIVEKVDFLYLMMKQE